jgi:predicted regulator of Ras-like GTPase activity (Roadblock/LC7/MglB family)
MNGEPAGGASSAPSPFGQGLGSLFDLVGVYGSFLVTPAGDVAARALPEIVDDATLAEVSGRVIRLGDTFRTVGIDAELCVLRFAEHKIYIKTLQGGILCIVTGSQVSVPALRMAANLVARKVGPELARRAASATGSAAPATTFQPRASSSGFAAVALTRPAAAFGDAAAADATIAAAAPPSPTSRMYRGRPMG